MVAGVHAANLVRQADRLLCATSGRRGERIESRPDARCAGAAPQGYGQLSGEGRLSTTNAGLAVRLVERPAERRAAGLSVSRAAHPAGPVGSACGAKEVGGPAAGVDLVDRGDGRVRDVDTD